MTGALVAVVGPSGSGKDAVIGFAAERLASRADVVFPKRVITRPAGAGEDHLPVSEAEFAALAAGGGFALTWEAHGLRYGVPAEVAEAVRGGAVAVVNVSRAVLDDLGDGFARVRAVRVRVPDDVRRERILARGREVSDAVQARLDREDPAPGFPYDLDIVNDGALADAGERLVALIESLR